MRVPSSNVLKDSPYVVTPLKFLAVCPERDTPMTLEPAVERPAPVGDILVVADLVVFEPIVRDVW